MDNKLDIVAVSVGAPSQEIENSSAFQCAIGTVVVLGVTFNALLAVLNVHVFSVTTVHVMLAEALILGGCLAAILVSGLRDGDLPPILLAGAFLIISIFVTMINQSIYLDSLRNIMIIALFAMLGQRLTFATLKRVVMIVVGVVTTFLALEAFALQTFVAVFEPAKYFEDTRGLVNPEFNDTGLFANALSFEDRFSFGLLPYRASSIFLEQVSLANFGIVILVFLTAFWSKISVIGRVCLTLFVIAILVTTDSRTLFLLCGIAFIGYFLFARLPSYTTLAIVPLLLLLALALMQPQDARLQDDVLGRLTGTMRTLGELSLPDILGASAPKAAQFADSGYTYLLYSSTIVGLLALWLFIAIYLPQRFAGAKRSAFLLNCVFATTLLVAGTSMFSIKIAALLWTIVGLTYRWPFADFAGASEATPTLRGKDAGDESRGAQAFSWPTRHLPEDGS